MKKLIIIFIFILFFNSCSNNGPIKNEKDKNKYNSLLEEKRKEFNFIKEKFNDYKKINVNKCNNTMKNIFIYNLSFCIPADYVGISPMGNTLDIKNNDNFNNYSSLELVSIKNKSNRIYIDVFSNIIENNNLGIIYGIDDNKVFFKQIHKNQFDSSMLIDNGMNLIKFDFNIINPTDREIIKSINHIKK